MLKFTHSCSANAMGVTLNDWLRGRFSGGVMFKRSVSFFAAVMFAAPTLAKGSNDQPDTQDLTARLGRAKVVIDQLTGPTDTGGITRDTNDPYKITWYNWNNFRKFKCMFWT